MKPAPSIMDLPDIVAALPEPDREVFQRLFWVSVSQGRLRVPPAMAGWIKDRFGSLERVESQTVVRVVNRVTLEGALVNPLRASRPVESTRVSQDRAIRETGGSDAFSRPLEMTTEDPFGRVLGKASVSASNVAKADAIHGLVIFSRGDPLSATRDELADYLDVAWRWLQRAHAEDPEAVYPFVIWNCFWRAGASVLHGHIQMLLARGIPYTRTERLRAAASEYRRSHGRDYFMDLFRAHEAVGCGARRGETRVLVSLTPTKEREVVVLAPAFGRPLAEALYAVLDGFRGAGVRSFNVGIAAPPLAGDGRDWTGFPVVAQLVDRGDLRSAVSDMGSLELFAEPVVTTDPLALGRDLAGWLSGQG